MLKYVLVTGRSGSGKSTISKALAKLLGYEYLDVDKVQHMIYDDKDILDINALEQYIDFDKMEEMKKYKSITRIMMVDGYRLH